VLLRKQSPSLYGPEQQYALLPLGAPAIFSLPKLCSADCTKGF